MFSDLAIFRVFVVTTFVVADAMRSLNAALTSTARGESASDPTSFRGTTGLFDTFVEQGK